MTPGVFITVDVECSMGGAWHHEHLRPVPPARAIMGSFAGRELGLPLIADILDRHGLRATFFVEPFLEEQGYPGQGEEICRWLLDRGQDVQLHIHPNHKHYGLHRQGLPYPFTDTMAELAPQAQRALLEQGRERLARWTGRAPAAFRAGNMGASEQTLAQLAGVGIGIDSSYAACFLGGQCRFGDHDPFNGSRWYGQVLEVALSCFRQASLPGMRPSKPLDVMGVSFEECREAIRAICAAGAEAVVILHSFSLFKVRNAQFEGGRPDRVVTRRFERLCRWLAQRPGGIAVYTFAELDQAVRAGQYRAKAVPPCRLTGPLAVARAALRKSVQAVNRLPWV